MPPTLEGVRPSNTEAKKVQTAHGSPGPDTS
jgi:hypothetical protein